MTRKRFLVLAGLLAVFARDGVHWVKAVHRPKQSWTEFVLGLRRQ